MTSKLRVLLLTGSLAISTSGGLLFLNVDPAFAGTAVNVNLGTAGNYSVLGGSTITNTGPTVMAQDLGLYPGSSVTGFPPGSVLGTQNINDAAATLAQNDTTTAYLNAAGQSGATSEPADLGGLTLNSGIYSTPSGAFSLTGTLTLNGQGNPNGVFIFQMASTLTTASASNIVLINSANPCNIYWQVGSSATLGTSSSLDGTVLALTSITADTSATVSGRLLARNGAVTLDSNTITNPTCLATSSSGTTTTASGTTTTSSSGTTTTASGTTTTASGVTGTTSVTSGKTPVTVPTANTGKPWSGWLWWTVALTGISGSIFFLWPRRWLRR